MPENRAESRISVTDGTLDRRHFLLGCGSFAAVYGLGGDAVVQAVQAEARTQPAMQSRPNILFMLGDNVG